MYLYTTLVIYITCRRNVVKRVVRDIYTFMSSRMCVCSRERFWPCLRIVCGYTFRSHLRIAIYVRSICTVWH